MQRFERILAGWAGELGVRVYRGREVTGFAQDDVGVDVELSDGRPLRAEYLVGCDGGRSLIRKAAGIEFPGWDPTTSCLIADVEMAGEPEWGFGRDAVGFHALHRLGDGGLVRVVVTEQRAGQSREPTPPAAVLIRPDGYVAWAGDLIRQGLTDALTNWFGPPTAAQTTGTAARTTSCPTLS
jgi:2-polyprenyl-6-methoxyphenol hydroxylase-like FAD-dependent oxidoreductase